LLESLAERSATHAFSDVGGLIEAEADEACAHDTLCCNAAHVVRVHNRTKKEWQRGLQGAEELLRRCRYGRTW
jgi:hypothetical protein